jgi:hypothetical protein
MFECEIIMENVKLKEMVGKEVLIQVPFSFNLSIITGFRQSVDNEGNIEDYTVIYTNNNESYCIDIHYGEFKYIYKKYQDDNKTV